jgi:hypothetical protein
MIEQTTLLQPCKAGIFKPYPEPEMMEQDWGSGRADFGTEFPSRVTNIQGFAIPKTHAD